MKRAVAKWSIDCGERLAKKRQERGLSRRALADLCGIAEPTITRIENGSLNARDDLRWIIAGAMYYEVADIWPSPPLSAISTHRDPVAA